MGDKRRTKSQGKSAKATKHGLRPHEQREQQDTTKNGLGQVVLPRGGGKPPRT